MMNAEHITGVGGRSGVPSRPPGVHVLDDGAVLFVTDQRDARAVQVLGDFGAGEAPVALGRSLADGLWRGVTGALAPGAYFYRYLVDERGALDPHQPMCEQDASGRRLSAIGIGGRDLGDPRCLRVATLNLRMHQEPEPLLKLVQVAYGLAALRADAVALQAVALGPLLPHAGTFVAAQLMRFTGERWHHAWRAAHDPQPGLVQGVSLLSRRPLRHIRELDLGGSTERRNALCGIVDVDGWPVQLCSAQVSWRGDERAAQVPLLLRGLRPGGPVAATVLAGDFNAEPEDTDIGRIQDAGYRDVDAEVGEAQPTYGETLQARIDYQFLHAARDFEAPQPVRCIRIFARNVDANTYQPRVSDHVGLLASYRFPDVPGADEWRRVGGDFDVV